MRNTNNIYHQQQQLFAAPSADAGYDFNRARSSESTEATSAAASHKASLLKTPAATTTVATTPVPQTPPRQDLHRNNNNNNTRYGGGTTTTITAFSFPSEDDRGVPITPKKIPLTPPRDGLSSPCYKSPPTRTTTRTTRRMPTVSYTGQTQAVRQPILESSVVVTPLPRPSAFLRPSTTHQQHQQQQQQQSWRAKEAFGIFRFRSEESLSSASRDTTDQGFYTIHRCNAFDEDTDSDDDDDDQDNAMDYSQTTSFQFY